MCVIPFAGCNVHNKLQMKHVACWLFNVSNKFSHVISIATFTYPFFLNPSHISHMSFYQTDISDIDPAWPFHFIFITLFTRNF